ncbi:DUF1206 domain-containing protein [Kribbella solani]|uniref:DUF1206 domain-containing protein n=1 Tax=Kribbella solani TaxID=236067 RepID=UPI0029BF58D2|nr:DUF1206 domain-containing protein [Kribbella solani]MDX2974282.1 DUF1206 domain-containing protein [Kribbella solani]MDX3004359.1 DUF1206 domain-containing protein [Kribbella solani]
MSTAQEVRHSRAYGLAITLGLLAYGVVHLLIAWIALQLAWGRSPQEASQQGALQELAGQPLGGVLLWVVAIGLLALVVWRALELIYGHLGLETKVSSVGRAVVYLFLGISAIRVAVGAGGSSTSKLHKAVTKKFTEDLAGGVSGLTILLGRIGYAAKGIAFGVVGMLFGWAAISYDPQKAGGLDTALRTVKQQPFGSVLLTILALGFAAFGGYAFSWSRNARK